MSEPKAVARRVVQIAPGVLHWSVHDERIGNRSDAYALTNGADTVLVDPLPLESDAVSVLGAVKYVVVTIQSHQRSAWRIRKQLKVPVFAPIRVAVTGSRVSPGLYESLELLGRETSLERLRRGQELAE